jgi:anthranilate phosphoribosyltransferase
VRKKLGVRTIFNLLGPLANPAGARFQLMGVGMGELRPVMAQALAKLGTERALVVTGQDGLADVTLDGLTDVAEVSAEGLSKFTWRAEDFGLTSGPIDALTVDGPEGSAAMIREILSGTPGPPRDIIVLNAAAAIITVGATTDPIEAARRAAEAIDSGAAADLLARLAKKSQ